MQQQSQRKKIVVVISGGNLVRVYDAETKEPVKYELLDYDNLVEDAHAHPPLEDLGEEDRKAIQGYKDHEEETTHI